MLLLLKVFGIWFLVALVFAVLFGRFCHIGRGR